MSNLPARPIRPNPPGRSKPFWFPLLGLGFTLAGADKLMGQPGYQKLFGHWGWSPEAMRLVGAAEVAGGVLVASAWGRRLGGLALTAASTAVLTAEVERSETRLAVPRLMLLAAAVLAAMPGPR